MKKWIVYGITILVVFVIILSVYFINQASFAGEYIPERYLEIGRTKTPLVEITAASHYYGTDAYVILFGMDEHDEEMVIWMKDDLTFLRHAWLKEAIHKEAVDQKVRSEYNVKKKIKITPGVESDIFLWEAIYTTDDGEYLYAYYDFFSGDLLRSIKLRNHN